MAVEDWSTTAASNTSVGAVSIAEGMTPANVNNAIREVMKQIADWRDGAIADLGESADYQPIDATLTALAAIATAADKLVYATGSDTFATTDFTAYARTLLALSSKAAVQSELGAVTVTASSLANPGYIKLNIGGTNLMIQWGTGTLSGNSTGTISYPQTYSTFAVCLVGGGASGTGVEGGIRSYGASGLSSQTIVNAGSGGSATYNFLVIGV
jgi:hypothetical protein